MLNLESLRLFFAKGGNSASTDTLLYLLIHKGYLEMLDREKMALLNGPKMALRGNSTQARRYKPQQYLLVLESSKETQLSTKN